MIFYLGRRPGKTREKDPKLGNFSGSFLSVPQAAKALGVDPKTVKGWCESGKLPAIIKPYGKTVTYQISSQALDLFLIQREKKQEASKAQKKQAKLHQEYIEPWKKAMARGLLNGRAFSPRTIEVYCIYAEPFINHYKSRNRESFQTALLNTLQSA